MDLNSEPLKTIIILKIWFVKRLITNHLAPAITMCLQVLNFLSSCFVLHFQVVARKILHFKGAQVHLKPCSTFARLGRGSDAETVPLPLSPQALSYPSTLSHIQTPNTPW